MEYESIEDYIKLLTNNDLAVFPVKRRGKFPITKNGFYDAKINQNEALGLFNGYKSPNIGVVTGSASGGLVIIDCDVDDEKGEDGLETLRKFELENGELPQTVSAITGRGGLHLYYRSKNEYRCSQNEELGIDIRAEGGYAVAPPSIHENGNRYEFENHPDEYNIEEVDELVDKFIKFVQKDSIKDNKISRDRFELPEEIGDGERNATLYKYACSLQAQGFSDTDIFDRVVQANIERTNPRLKNDEIVKIVDSALTKEKGKKQRNQDNFNHARFSDQLIDKYNICFIGGVPSYYDGKVYKTGKHDIEVLMVKEKSNIKSQQRTECYKYIELVAPRHEPASDNYIAFANGIFDLDAGDLIGYSKDIYVQNLIPHNYNPSAECKELDDMLMRISCEDDGIYSNLIETIGICMYRGTEFACCPLFIDAAGDGSNGKSTYINLLRSILGKDNYSSLDLSTVGERFQSVAIMGKLANLGDDISNEFVNGKKASIIKKIITGDEIEAEYKGGDTFSFSPYSTLVFSMNDMPRLGDSTGGMMRRLHPIPFNARFKRGDKGFNPRISKIISTEEAIEHAIYLGIIGLSNCIVNNGMTVTSATTAAVNEIKMDNDNVVQFVNSDEVIFSEDILNRKASSLYEDYKEYCYRNTLEKRSFRNFNKAICNIFNLEIKAVRQNGVPVKAFCEKS